MEDHDNNSLGKWVIRIVSAGVIGLLVFLLKQDHDNVMLRIQTLETITLSLQLQQRSNEAYLESIQRTLERIENRQNQIRFNKQRNDDE